jgi:hypothetical protein
MEVANALGSNASRAPEKMSEDRHALTGEPIVGWIGVDLDGCLAEHYWPRDGSFEIGRIGRPIPLMVERVKGWLGEGREVRIFTARVGPQPPELEAMARVAIAVWTQEVFGVEIKATATKDFAMIALFDDRCIQVEMNTGRIIEAS